MTFPLGSAKLLLLHRELWCFRRASLTKTTSTRSHWLGWGNPWLGQGISSNDCSARTHTEGVAWTCSASVYLLFFAFSPCHSYTETQSNSQIRQSLATETQEQRQKSANGCIPVSPFSPVSAFYQRHEQPVRLKLPIPKPGSSVVSKTMARWLPSSHPTVFIYFSLDL